MLAFLGLGTAMVLWSKAFPVIDVDFKITRNDAEKKMEQWLIDHGYGVQGYKHSVVFNEDGEQKDFLELEAGSSELRRLTRDGLNIWAWGGRWFRPEQQEEFGIAFDLSGRLVNFNREIKESASAPYQTEAQARATAEAFIQKNIPQHPLDQLIFLSSSSIKQEHRTDYTFVWKRPAYCVKDGVYKIDVTIYGNAVGRYNEYLDVPESWTREFDKKRESNRICQTIAEYAQLPLGIFLGILSIINIRKRRMRWLDSMPWGMVGILGLVAIANQINGIPGIFEGYSTTDRWSSYLAEQISSGMREVIWAVVGFWLLALVAEPIYRSFRPEAVPLGVAWSRKSLRDPRIRNALWIGVALAFLSMGYVCAFYVVGSHCKIWSPVEIDYSKALSGLLPWVDPMQVGFSAAIYEELLFRIAAIAMYLKLVRNRYVAIILAAASWAFLHSNYPQMPGYVRGIELTIDGTIWGLVMWRYGILATLVAHYSYDCWMGCLMVFKSGRWIDMAGAVAASGWPVALAIYVTWVQRTQGEVAYEESQSVASEEEYRPEAGEGAAMPYFLPKAWLTRLILMAAIVLLVSTRIHIPHQAMHQFGRLHLSKEQVLASSDSILRSHGVDPARYQKVLSEGSNWCYADYILKFGSWQDCYRLLKREWPDVYFHVRYFRFGDPEEFAVTLSSQGQLWRWNHSITRETPGASLTRDQALDLARRELAGRYGVDLSREKLVSEDLTQQLHRRDYYFEFERIDWKVGKALLRTSLMIQGDEAVSFDRYVKIPEDWEREQSATGWKDVLISEFKSWMDYLEMAVCVVVLILMIRRGLLPWRTGLIWGIFPVGLEIVQWFNGWPQFYASYSTQRSLRDFLLHKWGGWIFGLAGQYVTAVMIVAVALGLLQWAFQWKPSWKGLKREMQGGKSEWLGALFLSVVLLHLSFAMNRYLDAVFRPESGMWFGYPGITNAVPWLGYLIEAVKASYERLIKLGVLASVIALLNRRFRWGGYILILILAMVRALGEKSWHDSLLELTIGNFGWISTLFLLETLWRYRPWLITSTLLINALLTDITLWLGKGGPEYRWQVAPLISFLVLIILWVIWKGKDGGVSRGEVFSENKSSADDLLVTPRATDLSSS